MKKNTALTYRNVDFIPRNGAQDVEFSSFDVEAEIVDLGGVEGEEDRIQRQALDLGKSPVLVASLQRTDLPNVEALFEHDLETRDDRIAQYSHVRR